MIGNLQQLLEEDEGRRLWPYNDTRGILTWGVGHNLAAAPICATARALIDQAIDAQFTHDIGAIRGSMVMHFPWFDGMDVVRQAALIDMGFNLGFAGLMSFAAFLVFISRYEWMEAAADLRKTLVYRQLPNRYERLAQMLETGRWPG